jgi:hypothetical protein
MDRREYLVSEEQDYMVLKGHELEIEEYGFVVS